MTRPFTSTARARLASITLALAFLAGCAESPVEQFEVIGSGDLEGQLFHDVDNNRVFSPLGGDTLLSGVAIEVRERGTEDVLASDVTDAEGTFAFADLPPGTHDVYIVTDGGALGDLIICLNPMPASVYIDEERYLTVGAKLGCVIPIAEAEEEPVGETVTVAGVVTAPPGVFRNDNAYIQDPTGGILMFGVPSAAGLQLGDSIEVTGRLEFFNQEAEIVDPIIAPNITRNAEVPAPKVLSTSTIAGLGANAADIGRLITVEGVAVSGFDGPTDRNGVIDDGSGPAVVRLDGRVLDNSVITPASFTAGACYDITGILGTFNGTAQLKPRYAGDVVEVPCS